MLKEWNQQSAEFILKLLIRINFSILIKKFSFLWIVLQQCNLTCIQKYAHANARTDQNPRNSI